MDENLESKKTTFNYREWRERNRKLELERRKLQVDGMSKYADHAEAEKRAIEENNTLDVGQKKKLKMYLAKLLAIQHLVQKKGTTAEFIKVIGIREEFIRQLTDLSKENKDDLSKESKELLNEFWKKYK